LDHISLGLDFAGQTCYFGAPIECPVATDHFINYLPTTLALGLPAESGYFKKTAGTTTGSF
jgi:hypothetical protein